MTKFKRKLLIFHDQIIGPSPHPERVLSNWQIEVAHNLKEAAELLNIYCFHAGLCLLESCESPSDYERLTKLFGLSSHTHWVLGLLRESTSPDALYPLENQLITQYCHAVLCFPVTAEKLSNVLEQAYEMAEISQKLRLQNSANASVHGIIGNSPPMHKLFKQIERISKEDFAVLIEGETGTGKELVAKAIHAKSARSGKPFVAINCGGIPQELIQSELFGYEKGAFTGANQRKIGFIESAQGGTLFLDEIGDLPLVQQANLLRFLEEKAIERLGSTHRIDINLRIIAATHVDLKQAVRAGKFREDLYFRLKVLEIKTPPLRERGPDIELIAQYYFDKFSRLSKRRPKGFSSEALFVLHHHDWPGNIRELLNCVRNAVIMSENRLLSARDLGLDKRKRERKVKLLEEARADADREAIMASIQNSRYNISRAANDLGISRVSLYRLIEKYRLKI